MVGAVLAAGVIVGGLWSRGGVAVLRRLASGHSPYGRTGTVTPGETLSEGERETLDRILREGHR
jgi:hypothetical protein